MDATLPGTGTSLAMLMGGIMLFLTKTSSIDGAEGQEGVGPGHLRRAKSQPLWLGGLVLFLEFILLELLFYQTVHAFLQNSINLIEGAGWLTPIVWALFGFVPLISFAYAVSVLSFTALEGESSEPSKNENCH